MDGDNANCDTFVNIGTSLAGNTLCGYKFHYYLPSLQIKLFMNWWDSNSVNGEFVYRLNNIKSARDGPLNTYTGTTCYSLM